MSDDSNSARQRTSPGLNATASDFIPQIEQPSQVTMSIFMGNHHQYPTYPEPYYHRPQTYSGTQFDSQGLRANDPVTLPDPFDNPVMSDASFVADTLGQYFHAQSDDWFTDALLGTPTQYTPYFIGNQWPSVQYMSEDPFSRVNYSMPTVAAEQSDVPQQPLHLGGYAAGAPSDMDAGSNAYAFGEDAWNQHEDDAQDFLVDPALEPANTGSNADASGEDAWAQHEQAENDAQDSLVDPALEQADSGLSGFDHTGQTGIQFAAGATLTVRTASSDARRPSVQEVNMAHARGLKRKAVDEPDDDEQPEEMMKADPAEATTPSGDQTKSSGRKSRYADLEGVENSQFPDFSHLPLRFSTRDAASANFPSWLRTIEDAFIPADQDTTIPQNDVQRQAAVRIILGALRDTTHAKDSKSSSFKSRWIARAPKGYSDSDLEATAWNAVHLAERLHREGPSALSIHDPNYLTQIQGSAHLTFDQRLRVIATLVMEWKARADGLIKGDTLQTMISAPLEALQSARTNAEANKHRGKQLTFAKEHEDAPKRPVHPRKRAKKQNTENTETTKTTKTTRGTKTTKTPSGTKTTRGT